jgi:hypothetical protein
MYFVVALKLSEMFSAYVGHSFCYEMRHACLWYTRRKTVQHLFIAQQDFHLLYLTLTAAEKARARPPS